MALKIKDFELPDETVLEEAYLRISSINTALVDYEFYETVQGSDDIILKWKTGFESKANVYVYADEVARNHRVSPINWFEFRFDLELDSNQNIYQQAYNRLKQIYPEGENA